jgi:hypothetical protein
MEEAPSGASQSKEAIVAKARKRAAKKAPAKKRLVVKDEPDTQEETQGAVATATKEEPAGEGSIQEITTRTRQYVGPWGPEWICEVENVDIRVPGIIWNVVLNGDERRFIQGGKCQLSEGHLEILDHAVIVDEVIIPEGSGYLWNKAEAEAHNPGMNYVIEAGVPKLLRRTKRYVYSKLRPAEKAPIVHGGISGG